MAIGAALISAGAQIIGSALSKKGQKGGSGDGTVDYGPPPFMDILAAAQKGAPVAPLGDVQGAIQRSSQSQQQAEARQKYYQLLANAMQNAGGAEEVFAQLQKEMKNQNPQADAYAFGSVPIQKGRVS